MEKCKCIEETDWYFFEQLEYCYRIVSHIDSLKTSYRVYFKTDNYVIYNWVEFHKNFKIL